MKETILIFNGYYFPAQKYGGPATSIKNMVDACGDKYNFCIIVCNHDFGEKKIFKEIKEGWNEVGNAKVLYVKDEEFTIKNIKKWIVETKAKAIYLAGIYSIRNFKYINAANKYNVPIVVPPRGELNPNAIKRKGYKKIPFLFVLRTLGVYKNAYFHVTSNEEKKGVQKWLGIKREQIFLLPNLPATFVDASLHKKNEKFKVVSISRICKTKNILYSIKVVNQLKRETEFDIYGPMEDSEYWNKCLEEIKKAPEYIHIRYCGTLTSADVCPTFKKYDCFIFPTLTENYGHSIAESLMAGCPVVLSKGTTPWDDLNEVAGATISLNDEEAFAMSLENIAKLSKEEYEKLSEKCIEYVNKKTKYTKLKNQYMDLWEGIICQKD